MQSVLIKYGKRLLLISPICFLLPLASAEDSIQTGEDYYGNDIGAAVLEAKQNKRKVNYSNQYWYNRTTSKSFDLPKLGRQDLENERLEGALVPTAAGNEATSNSDIPSEHVMSTQQNLERNDKENKAFSLSIDNPKSEIEKIYLLPSTSHEFSRGDKVSTYGIINSGTVTSSLKP